MQVGLGNRVGQNFDRDKGCQDLLERCCSNVFQKDNVWGNGDACDGR
jgi:hypothetical protein